MIELLFPNLIDGFLGKKLYAISPEIRLVKKLPNAKELESIVDYSRSPQTTRTPAIKLMI